MDSTNTWSQVDSRDARLLALTTRINELENNQKQPFSGDKDSGRNKANNDAFKIEDWRFVKDGETVTRDGKNWWWCEQHNNGKGMYVRHPPNEHADWAARKKAGEKYVPPDYRSNYKSGQDQSSQSKPKDEIPEPKKLVLTENLKSVLSTTMMLSDQDVDHVCNQVFKNV